MVSKALTIALICAFAGQSSVNGLSSDASDIRFLYYPTATSYKEIIFNDVSSLSSSGFKDNAETIIIIDGFLSDSTSPMSQGTKSGFISKQSSSNVIVIDWGKLSGSGSTLENSFQTSIMYSNVLGNVGPVAARVAEFLDFLRINKNIKLSEVYIVGHSLGAHIAGAVGYHVQQKFGTKIARITGLDPAGPLFSDQTNMDKRLDKGDATFVDIYHTNRGTLGDSALQKGHINVFLNGGASQPGCAEADATGYEGYCSHSFSWKFFGSAFDNSFTACPCSGYACQCADCSLTCDSPIPLGYKTQTSATGAYYAKTSAIP